MLCLFCLFFLLLFLIIVYFWNFCIFFFDATFFQVNKDVYINESHFVDSGTPLANGINLSVAFLLVFSP